MKRFLAWCLTAAMILTMLPSLVFAAAVPASGKLEGTLAVKGGLKEGETLSADLAKVKPEGVKADQLKYEWFQVDKNGKSKSISKEATYKVKTEDIDNYIQLTITAKDGEAVTGSLSTSKLGPIVDKNSVAVNAAASPTPTQAAAQTGVPADSSASASSDAAVNVGTPAPSSSDPGVSVQNETASAGENNSPASYSVPTAAPTQAPANENSAPAQTEQYAEKEAANPETESDRVPENNTSGNTGDTNTVNEPAVNVAPNDNSSVTVQQQTETITTSSLPDGTVGEKYSAVLEASGQVDSWEIVNNVVPQGLDVNGSTGEIFGTPTAEFDSILRVKANFSDGSSVTKDLDLNISESEQKEENEEPKADEDTDDTKEPQEDPSSGEETPIEKVPSLSAGVEKVDFGTLYEGYEAQEFDLTLINSGNADATDLKGEVSGDLANVLTVGALSEIKSGDNVTVSLTLEKGLKIGDYSSKLVITGAEDVKLTVPVTVSVKEKEYAISISEKSLDFGTHTEGYSEISASEITITNDSIFPVTVNKPDSKYFIVGGQDGKTINAGEEAQYSIRPDSGLKEGTYEDTLTFLAKEGAKASVTVKVVIKEKDQYSFEVYWANGNGNFGYAPLGYDDENGYAPHSRNLVIRNTSNKTLEFKQPVSNSGAKTVYNITQLDEATLKSVEPGETITVAVRPVMGLTADVYDEDIVVDAVNDGKDPVIGAHVTFQVVGKSIYRGVDQDQGTVVVENGAPKTAKGLGLPATVKARTTAGVIDVNVSWWGVDECDYNPASKEEQNFTVWGSIELPSNVGNYLGLSRYTSIGVRVLAYDPKEANTAENKIYGIAQGDVFQAGKTISFSAEGSGMNRKSSPEKGDVRYEPTYWKVADTNAKWSTEGSWNKSPYSASFAIGSSGSYKLRVTFTKEMYDGEKWVSQENDNDGVDVKSVSFKIQGTATVSSAKNNTVTKVKQAVKTGDDTEILPMVLLAAAGFLVIGGTGIMMRSNKKKRR